MDSFRMGVPWQQAADGVPAAPADPGLRAPGEGRCSAAPAAVRPRQTLLYLESARRAERLEHESGGGRIVGR